MRWFHHSFAPQRGWRERRERQQRMRGEREARSQSDAEFLERLPANAGAERRAIAVLIRKAVACQCGLAPEEIRSEDPTGELEG